MAAGTIPLGDDFHEVLRDYLAAAESFATQEIDRMRAAMASLRKENEVLKKQQQTPLGRESTDTANSNGTFYGNNPFEDDLKKRQHPDLVVNMEFSDYDSGNNGALRLSGTSHCAPTTPGTASFRPSFNAVDKLSALAESNYERSKAAATDKAQPSTRGVREMVNNRNVNTDSCRFYKNEGIFQRIAKHEAFQYGTLLLVLFNSMWMAIDLDFNGQPWPQSPFIFQFMENFFLIIFSSEMVIRFIAFRSKVNVFYDAWFIFDATLVLVMIVDSWVLTLLLKDIGDLGNLSALRILRLLRLARVAQICRLLPELQTVINSMVAGLRSVLMTAVMLMFLTYCFALLMRQLGGETGWGQEGFNSVPMSCYTLLVSSILPDHAELLTEIGKETWYCGVVYFSFLLLSVVMVMNMLIAILCDVISRESSAEKDQRTLDTMTYKLRKILRSIDVDSNDLVSQAEFDNIITNEEAVGLLADVGVDVVALAEESDLIFGMRGREMLPFETFKEEVLKFRSNNFATLGSITATRRYIRSGLEIIAHKLDFLEHIALANHGSNLSQGEPTTKASTFPAMTG